MERRSFVKALAASPALLSIPQASAAPSNQGSMKPAELAELLVLNGAVRMYEPQPFLLFTYEGAATEEEQRRKYAEESSRDLAELDEAWSNYLGTVEWASGNPEYSWDAAGMDEGWENHPDQVALRSLFGPAWSKDDCRLYTIPDQYAYGVVHEPSGVVLILGETWFLAHKVDVPTMSARMVAKVCPEYGDLTGSMCGGMHLYSPESLPL